MNNNMKKKSILIIGIIILVGLLIIGGTYAYLSLAMNITNGNYATNTHCFDVSYSYNSNEDGTFVSAIGQSNLIGTVTDYEAFSFINGAYVYDASDGVSAFDPYITFNFSSQLVANKQYVLQFDADINCSYPYSYIFPSSGANAREFINGENTLFFTPQSSINSGTLTMTFDTSTEYDIVTLSNFRIYDFESGNLVGTLFPSGTAAGGINGGITAATSPSCALTTGRGTLYLHVDSGTSSVLTNPVAPHCENKYTLETIKNRIASSCTGENMKWVTNGTALKYAVYDNDSRTHLYATGYIDSSFIGKDKVIHTDFSVTNTQKTYYLYIWLDGYVSDDTYTDLPFSATSRLSVTQTKSTDTTFTGDSYTTIGNSIYQYDAESLYQRVEYLESTGTQYIDTGIKFNSNYDRFELKYKANDADGNYFIAGSGWDETGKIWVYSYKAASRFAIYITNIDGTQREFYGFDGPDTLQHLVVYDAKKLYIDGQLTADQSSYTFGETPYNFSLFNAINSNGHYSKARIYLLKIWKSNILTRNMIPVYRKSDGKPGLYDMVNNVFYTNAATSGDDFILPPGSL